MKKLLAMSSVLLGCFPLFYAMAAESNLSVSRINGDEDSLEVRVLCGSCISDGARVDVTAVVTDESNNSKVWELTRGARVDSTETVTFRQDLPPGEYRACAYINGDTRTRECTSIHVSGSSNPCAQGIPMASGSIRTSWGQVHVEVSNQIGSQQEVTVRLGIARNGKILLTDSQTVQLSSNGRETVSFNVSWDAAKCDSEAPCDVVATVADQCGNEVPIQTSYR